MHIVNKIDVMDFLRVESVLVKFRRRKGTKFCSVCSLPSVSSKFYFSVLTSVSEGKFLSFLFFCLEYSDAKRALNNRNIGLSLGWF